MTDAQIMRKYVRHVLNEEVNNFLGKEEQTTTKQLANPEPKSQVLGDPLEVQMNVLADETGSDEQNAPTVSVKAGDAKSGSDFNAGQLQASFQEKTELAK
jgi:hypothetical protein